jgi:hypothetical protein
MLRLRIHKSHHTECSTFTFLHSNSFTRAHQQDGDQPHFSRHFTEVLSATFPGRWLGKGGSLLWPPRGPVSTPLDSSFRGYVNNYVYMDKIRDLNRLEARIGEAAEQITRNMLQGVWQGVEYRLDTNRTHLGTSYVQNYLRCILKSNINFLYTFLIFLNIGSRNPTIIFWTSCIL